MADQNLTQLTATTSPTSDALVYIVDDPSGAPADRTITLTTLLSSAGGREKLTANRTYYVRTDGSDSNSGLVNDAGGAFLTIQAAVTLVASSLNLNGYDVTIQVADGTYAVGATIQNLWDGNGTVSIKGNATTPTNVIVSGGFAAIGHTRLVVRDLQCAYLSADSYGYLAFTNVTFADTSSQLSLITASNEGTVEATGNFKIAGGAYSHALYCYYGGTIVIPVAVTITGTPSFSVAFALIRYGSKLITADLYSGSVTGDRYYVDGRSKIICLSAMAITSFPGNDEGFRAAGSYVGFADAGNTDVVTSDQAITSSTTLTNSALSFSVEDARTYIFTAKLYTTSNVAGGVKAAIAGTATATSIIYEGRTISGGTTTQTRATALGTEVGAVTAVTAAYIEINGTIVTNAGGTLVVQFAQNASNAGATTLLTGSSFEVKPLGE